MKKIAADNKDFLQNRFAVAYVMSSLKDTATIGKDISKDDKRKPLRILKGLLVYQTKVFGGRPCSVQEYQSILGLIIAGLHFLQLPSSSNCLLSRHVVTLSLFPEPFWRKYNTE
jgi:hypothetical protein